MRVKQLEVLVASLRAENSDLTDSLDSTVRKFNQEKEKYDKASIIELENLQEQNKERKSKFIEEMESLKKDLESKSEELENRKSEFSKRIEIIEKEKNLLDAELKDRENLFESKISEISSQVAAKVFFSIKKGNNFNF